MLEDRNAAGLAFLDEARVRIEESVGLIHHCVEQIDDEQIWWRPRGEMNSIGNLLLHVAGNLRQRFRSDIGGEADARDRFAEFTERRHIPIVDLLATFDASVADALARLQALGPEALAETRSTRRLGGEAEKSVLAIAFQAINHLSGHAQEILHMTRMQLGGSYRFRNPGDVPPEMRTPG
ncbi:DUF1572 family protein [Paludisphaera soli]|uniref:DUF1572 family protein n=1 Tax=Paludisphaera soli TaxID=2712865 RepID=UPI0013EB9965|nr:DUF1572 family protein [Paludisphaera soli]